MKLELDLATIIAITLAGDAKIIGYGTNSDDEDVATIDITFHTDKKLGSYVHVTDVVNEEYRCFFGDKSEDLLKSVWKFLKKTDFCGFKFIDLWDVSIGIHRYDKYVGYVYKKDAVYIYVDPNGEGGFSAFVDNFVTHDSFIGTDASPFMALIGALRSAIEHGGFDYSRITSWIMDEDYARSHKLDEEDEEALYAPEPDIFCNIPEEDDPDYDYIPEDDDEEEENPLPF